MKTIKVTELSSKLFDGYGKILTQTVAEPLAQNDDFTYWDKVSQLNLGENVSTGILEVKKRDLVVDTMEKHVKTPEVIISLHGDSVFAVGKTSSEGKISDIKAFALKQGEGIAMDKGTWHWAPYPMEETAKFLVIFTEGTPHEDCCVKELDEPVLINL